MRNQFLLFILSSFLLGFGHTSWAQESPEKEFRGVWLTSVSNLDWPKNSDKGDSEAQKQDLIEMLDHFQAMNMNAVLFQIRPECDALYASDLEPWSRFLTGSQGVDPGYDPLTFAIEEAHKRGLELHAWMNPYRISSAKNPSDSYFGEGHVYKEHPEWAIAYDDGSMILNPGIPEVADYIAEVVEDVVDRYDVDGVHFDDYFYAYGGTHASLDQEQFDAYAEEGQSLAEFRRGSINSMVRKVYQAIKAKKEYVRFGISPFGIWSTDAQAAADYDVDLPAGIVGLDAYNTIYCDALAWMKEGTVDYITPQQYWPTGGGQDYETLNNWWADMSDKFDSHIYTGQGTYRLSNSPATRKSDLSDSNLDVLHEQKEYFDQSSNSNSRISADAWTLSQITRQVKINRANDAKGVKGSVYFRAMDFWRVSGLSDYMLTDVYQAKVLLPVMINEELELSGDGVTNIRFEQNEGETATLTWDYPDAENYRFIVLETTDPSTTPSLEDMKAIAYGNVFDATGSEMTNEDKYYSIWVYDRFGNVQSNEVWSGLEVPETPIITSESDVVLAYETGTLDWEHSLGAMSYRIEVSTSSSFQDLVFETDTVTQNSFHISQIDLDGEITYYWRIQALNLAGGSEYSSTASFEIDRLRKPSLLSPSDNEKDVDPLMTITWDALETAESFKIQIKSTTATFENDTPLVDVTVSASEKSYQITEALEELEYYDIRVKVVNSEYESDWVVHRFKTLHYPAETPQILSPTHHLVVEPGYALEVSWTETQNTSSYNIQISEKEDFSKTLKNIWKYDAKDTTYVFSGTEEDKTYYVRVAASNSGAGKGEWSEVVSFTTIPVVLTNSDILLNDGITVFPNPATKYIKFQTLDSSTPKLWLLRDLSGGIIKEGKAMVEDNNQTLVDVRDVEVGLYIFQVFIGDKIYSSKVYIQK
ncbi:family 10 glycosylhydrolase [Sediminitomix flava]|uniref:Putative secreted protein (Por secretion system target) n=1 Tax=Sediminitomix flava TaxID=379075 RepID=A0A315ZGH7_SEDFL|nr:family 10 glycosylhydrolase [Sediminitomix flava]PWJ43844.1 putative secreted protein (Por secretion system target) [Sediminitomix flava]